MFAGKTLTCRPIFLLVKSRHNHTRGFLFNEVTLDIVVYIYATKSVFAATVRYFWLSRLHNTQHVVRQCFGRPCAEFFSPEQPCRCSFFASGVKPTADEHYS